MGALLGLYLCPVLKVTHFPSGLERAAQSQPGSVQRGSDVLSCCHQVVACLVQ